MSLASIKQKEAKGRKNAFPKLRTVLANPYKQHTPILSDNELQELRNLLKAGILESELKPAEFATQTHIQLGLESSLRAINGRKFSCVFISLSLRPSHLIRLITSCASAKIPTAPIYAQPKLEEWTNGLFGIKTLCFVLPIDLDAINLDLVQWVMARKKPERTSKEIILKKVIAKRKVIEEEPKINTEVVTAAVPKQQWSGDYISCSDETKAFKLDQVDVHTEKEHLDKALSNMALIAKKNKLDVTKPQQSQQISEQMAIDEEESDEDVDEFLPQHVYRPLTVHQVQPNPNKQPKKKKKSAKKNA